MKDQCIIWEGPRWSQGRYGMDRLGSKSMGAHRAAWIRNKGEIPDGMVVCHKCDNGLCVNIDHLFLGTMKDNMQDCKSKGRLKRTDQKGVNNHNARSDYREIRIKAALMRKEGYSLSQIRKSLNIKSNGHLVSVITDGLKILKTTE
jgi:hypothetical protein